jgi:hypothetical protein
MKKILRQLSHLAVFAFVLVVSPKALATTCPNAIVLSPASLPIVNQQVICGATDDISVAAAAASVVTGGCANTAYFGGWEALYSFTPSATGQYDVSYNGQTWSGIFVFNGCPTTGGSTCVGGIASSTGSKSVTVNLTAGVTYYIMFDTWPSPQSPCPGSFSLTQILPNVATATATGGLWSSPATWVAGVVPNAASTVIIPAGSIVTVDQITNIASLDVSGILQWNTTSNAMTVLGNITINAGGKFLPYTTSTGGTTGIAINAGGDFINNGYCNFSAGASVINFLNFNGSQQVGGSLNQTLGGSGVFEGNGVKGIIRGLAFQTTGTCTINTAQDLIVNAEIAHTNGTLNTNGKLTLDNTAQCYGQPINTQVSHVAVTNMGATLSAAPVVCGVAVTPYSNGGVANLGTRYFFGNNVYLCTAGGTFNATPPTSNTPNAVFTTSGPSLLYIGTLGTLGTNVPYNSTLGIGTPYFYGDNWYQAIATTATTTMPTHVAGTVGNFRYLGPAAKVSVNFDAVTQTVRSLTITNAGSGWNSATAPSLAFSHGVIGATGTLPAATPVVLYSPQGGTVVRLQKAGVAAFTGGVIINSDQGASTASADPQASSGVGSIYTTNGGLNYTVAPQVGFSGPTALNLVTNQGSGYTTAPTVVLTGGTAVTSGTAPTFTVTMAQGKVVSVYLTSAGTTTYSVPPTLSLSAGNATIAWPANCWPAATANIGANGQITSFTVTNAGYGYVAPPTIGIGATSGTAAGGTFTTVATTPIARVALYNLTIANYLPTTNLITQADVADVIPPNRKINTLALSTGGLGLSLANNLTCFGTTPLLFTASPNGIGNVLALNGNTITTTWNTYTGLTSTFGASNVYLQNGSMAMYTRGGGTLGLTYNFPFSATFTTMTGNGTGGAGTGCDFTRLVVTETGAPTNLVTSGTGLSFGNRAFRLQGFTTGATPGISGTNPTVTLRYNSQDGLTSTQDQTFVNQAPALTGAWNVVSAAYGASGALPATGLLVTPTVAPGPVLLDGDDFFAWGTNAPTITNVSPLTLCAGSGQFTITGTNLSGVTNVLIGGTPVANFTIISPTQIDAFAGLGTNGVVSVVKNGATFNGAQAVTINASPAAPTVAVPNATVMLGVTATFSATGSGGTFSWYTAPFGGVAVATGASFTTPPACATTSYYVAESNGACEGPRTQVTVTVTPITFTSSVPNLCGNGGTITLTATPNDPTFSFAWTSDQASTSFATPGAISTTATLSQTSSIFLATTANGCTYNSTPISVGVYGFPAITPTATPNVLCDSGMVALATGITPGNFSAICITPVAEVPPANFSSLVTNGVATVPLNSGSLDDGGWGGIPIGFNFNYFGNTYTTINVGTNGVLQFGAYNAAALGDFTIGALPNAIDPTNAIFGCAHDLHNGYAGANVNYWTTGIAPNRKFVVNYQVWQFGNPSIPVNFQIILKETTGQVEIVATNVLSTAGKTIGVNNPTGTIGAAAPNCNVVPNSANYWQAQTATIPAANPQAWRFNPPVNYTINWTVNGIGTPAAGQLNGVTVNTPSTNQMTYATTPYQVYVADPITGCSQVYQTPVTVNTSPSAPTATNSTQCGLGTPTALVTSTAGANGNGQFFWFNAANNGTLVQTPPTGAYTAFYSENFNGPTIAAGGTLSGSANLINYPGQLQLFDNLLNQIGGVTVAAGVNATSFLVDFDLITSTGADGLSYSFGDDVNASAVTPSQEKGSGSKLKISFDSYGAMPNGQGIYLLYNNTAASFNNTSPGVVAYSSDISWVNDTSHIAISIDNSGKLSLAVGATTIFNAVQLPAAYLAANKTTWAHVISGRTGGISMLATIDNLLIQYANNVPGFTTVQTPINATTTYYVSELGTNGCYSAPTPLTVTVINPDPIVVTPGNTADICIGQSININGSSIANPVYTYSWDANTYNGSGFNSPLAGAAQTITPTTPGTYTLTITGTNGVCTATTNLSLNVNALPNITSATAGPLGVCNNGTVNLAATSFIGGPQTLPAAGYCATNNSGGAGSLIDNVAFNTINYNSAGNQPLAAPFYTATNQTTTVNAGQTYPLAVTVGPAGIYAGAIVSVWIDYNRNGNYEASEWQQVSTNMTNTTTTINVTIPANAQPGLTGMRIRSRGAFNTNGATSSCIFMGSGETEDYQVNIQIPPVNPFTYTWNTNPAASGANATTVATNPGPGNVQVNYIVTAIDPLTGCTNTDTTNNITVYPAILPPTVTNSSHCGVQVPTATANDVNGFVGPNYNWYATAVNANALQSNAANTFAGFIGNTTTLYVAVEDTLTGCETSSTPVTITVTPGPALTLAALGDTICVGGTSAAIGLSSGAGVYNTYSWTPAAGVSGNEITGWSFNPAVSTTYTLVATQSAAPNCSNQDTLSIQVDQVIPPTPTVPQNLFNICSGTNSLLLAASSPVVVNTFTYTLNMIDSWGDGWNGNTMSVFVNGNPVLSNVTFANGFNASLTFQVAAGNTITAQFNGGGAFINECTYNITNNNNTVIFSGTPASAIGPPNMVTPYTVPGIPQPNYVVNWYNASNNGANIGTGSPLQSVGTTVMPAATNGTYMFYAGLSLGACNGTTVPITVNVADVVATVTASNTCIGQTNGTFSATNFQCGTAPFTYSVNNGAFGAIPTNLAAGPHTVVIRDANLLLSSTYNITVGVDSTIPPAPIVPQAVYNACTGTNSVLVSANAPVNQGTQTYTLNMFDSFGDGWNNNTINVSVNGTVVLNGATFNNGFSSSVTFTVSGGNAVTTQFNAIGSWINECTYNITNAAGTVIFSGTPSSFQGPPNLNPAHIVPTPVQPNYVVNWYNASNNGAFVGTGSPFETVGTSVMPNSVNGTYMFYAGLSLGACNSATTVPVTVNIADVSATITPINATCNGVANGSFTATNFTCGTAPFDYSVNNGAYGAIPNNLPAGSHTVVIRDANNLLSSVYNITITQPAWTINAPVAAGNGSACVGDTSEIISATATINGQTQVVVDTFFLATNVFFPQGQGGTQSFTQNIVIPAGATVTGTVLSVNNVTTATGGWPGDYTIGLTGASTLGTTLLANVNQQVTNAGPYTQTPTLLSNNGGNVTVSLTNTWSPGTGFFGSIELIVTYTMPAAASNMTWWNSANAGAQVGSGLSLESVGTTILPNTLTPGTYNFYAQAEANGCSSPTRTLVTVVVHALPNVNGGNNQALCIGQSTSLTATGASTYSWTNGISNGVNFTPNATNTYVVTGVDVNGCVNQDTVTVVVNPLPTVSAGNDQTVCLNTPVVLSATGASIYTWTNGVTNNTPFTPVSTNNYIVTGTDVNGCINYDTVTVNVLPLPNVNAGQDFGICIGNGATLTATGANSYQWNNNVLNGVTFFPNTTTTYTVIGTGGNGCSAQDSITVTVNTTPSISLTNGGASCANGNVALNATSIGAFGGFWSTTNGAGTFAPNVSNASVVYNASVNDPSTVTFVYVAFNQCGASNDTTTINILGLPSVNAGVDAAICTNTNTTLTAVSNGTVVWNNNILDGVAFAVAAGNTQYIATATGANGCTNTDTVIITGLALPQVNAGNDQSICAGDFATLNASGAVSYAWDNNVIDGVPFAPSSTATYTVTGTGANGCNNTDNVTVTVNALPNAVAVAADPVTLVATPAGASYQWIDCASGQTIADATNDTLVATANGSYAVIVTNANGCSDTSECMVVDQVGLFFPESAVIALYPNPTNGMVTLELPAQDGAVAHIYDAQGKLILTVANAKNGEQFDLSKLTTGVYTFRVTLNNLTHIEKVVKQ